MDIQKAKKLIPAFLDDALEPKELQAFREILAKSPELRKEVAAYKKTWALLDEVEDIEPDPGYISRFWTRVAQEEPAHSDNYQVFPAPRPLLLDRLLEFQPGLSPR